MDQPDRNTDWQAPLNLAYRRYKSFILLLSVFISCKQQYTILNYHSIGHKYHDVCHNHGSEGVNTDTLFFSRKAISGESAGALTDQPMDLVAKHQGHSRKTSRKFYEQMLSDAKAMKTVQLMADVRKAKLSTVQVITG